MNKVISLKGLRFNRRKRISSRPKRNLDIKPTETDGFYKAVASISSIFSVLLGSLCFLKLPSAFFETQFTEIIGTLQSGNFISIFKCLICIEIIFVAVCFLLGTNLFGNFIIFLVPAAKTFFAGYLGALMYNKYELNGVLFSLVFLVPYFSATCTALIALSNEGHSMSKSLTASVLQRKTTKDDGLRLFLARFTLIFITDIIFTLLNSLILMSFGAKISLH